MDTFPWSQPSRWRDSVGMFQADKYRRDMTQFILDHVEQDEFWGVWLIEWRYRVWTGPNHVRLAAGVLGQKIYSAHNGKLEEFEPMEYPA